VTCIQLCKQVQFYYHIASAGFSTGDCYIDCCDAVRFYYELICVFAVTN